MDLRALAVHFRRIQPAAAGVVTHNNRMDLSLPELEQAINYWRSLRPSTGEEHALSPEVKVLATVYATMIFHQVITVPLDTRPSSARQLLAAWRTQLA